MLMPYGHIPLPTASFSPRHLVFNFRGPKPAKIHLMHRIGGIEASRSNRHTSPEYAPFHLSSRGFGMTVLGILGPRLASPQERLPPRRLFWKAGLKKLKVHKHTVTAFAEHKPKPDKPEL